MKTVVVLFILLFGKESLGQACLQSNLMVDPSCGCQIKNNCYKFFSPEYIADIKKVAGTNPKLVKAVIDNQKATTSAFNKIMSNRPVSQEELNDINKEAANLEKLNQRSLALMNAERAKNKKQPLWPEKDAPLLQKKLFSSLSPETQKKIKSQVMSFRDLPAGEVQEGDEEATTPSPEATPDEAPLTMAKTEEIKDEAQVMEERVAQEVKKDFDYTTEISSEKSRGIFGLISDRYQKVILKENSLPYHVDSEDDKYKKQSIKEDIRQMLILRSSKYD